MKKIFVLLFVSMLSLGAMAQLEVKQDSFTEVSGFVNISEKQNDINGTPYSVIKVRTENINDKERRRLDFDGGADVSYELAYKDGEVWIYITYLASQLNISHPEFGSVSFVIPLEMAPKKGYEMVLVNKVKAVSTGWGSLTLTTVPENGATITLNGKVLKVKTPYSNNMIAAGTYEIKVSLDNYQTVTQTVEIQDGENKVVEIEMPNAYGTLNVVTEPAGAFVFVDGENRGKTPIVLNVLTGQHDVTIGKKGFFLSNNKVFIEESKSQYINVTLQPVPEDAVNGYFTINDKGDKVLFSRGNLQYQPSTKIRRFAPNQFDYIGEDCSEATKKDTGWKDLFHWGTGNNLRATKNPDTPFYEWGDKMGNGWRTLTGDEWDYIINKRTTESGLLYATAEVNGVCGVILLPDDWNSSYYNFIVDDKKGCVNIISLSNWTQLFESLGAVFLPARYLRYWSKTAVPYAGSCFKAKTLEIWGGKLVLFQQTYRDSSMVRLVMDVKKN